MKLKIIKAVIVILLSSAFTVLYGWGAWGHKHILHSAVFALPPGMKTFYYNHIDFLTEASVVPDLRRGVLNDKLEPPRHFIDIENFGANSVDALPGSGKEAYAKYDSTFLSKNGILPWYIQTLMDKLTLAFQRKNKSEIIFLSAEIGHYLADAHVPLHTTNNHDGQLTNQKGLHALWESRIPDMFGSNYYFYTGDAKYIDDVNSELWRIIKQSHVLVDTVLAVERKVRSSFSKENLYKKDAAGNAVMSFNQPVFSDEYTSRYNEALRGMVQKQIQLSCADVANFWYTAWVNGGKPDLTSMDDPELTEHNRKNFKREMRAWNKGKILHLSIEKE